MVPRSGGVFSRLHSQAISQKRPRKHKHQERLLVSSLGDVSGDDVDGLRAAVVAQDRDNAQGIQQPRLRQGIRRCRSVRVRGRRLRKKQAKVRCEAKVKPNMSSNRTAMRFASCARRWVSMPTR